MGQIVELTGLPHCYILASAAAGVVAIFLADNVVFQKSDLLAATASSAVA